jgi:hypothetical protein
VRLGLGQCPEAGRGRLDEHEPTIVGHARALDEPVLLHPIDDPGRIRDGHADELCEAAHRHRAVVLEQPQDMQLAHAHVALDEAAHRVAAQLTNPRPDFCQDGLGGRPVGLVVRGVGGIRADRLIADSSHVVKHCIDVNDFVNIKYPCSVDDSPSTLIADEGAA